MVKSALLAGLIAVGASATPLMARSQTSSSWTTSYYPTSTSTSYDSYSTPAAAYATVPTLLGVATATPNAAIPSGLVAELLTADSAVSRDTILAAQDPTHFVFDFNPAANPKVKAGLGGQVDLANRANFPILTNLGISTAALFFQPCGLVPPHIHPRATEFFTLVTDSTVTTGFVAELGFLTQQNTTLTQYQGTVFPQGSMHFLQNQGCEPAVGISGLSSEDPGASFIAQSFLKSIDPEILDPVLGFPQIGADNFAQFIGKIPDPFVLGVESCLQRCGIAY
jgi:hypothetical protein